MKLVCAPSNGAIFSDLTTTNHPTFAILYRFSYFRSG